MGFTIDDPSATVQNQQDPNPKKKGFLLSQAGEDLPNPEVTPTESSRLSNNYILNQDLGDYMAGNQSGWELLGKGLVNTASSAVFGTVEAASYLLDFEQMVDKLKGEEGEYTNWLAEQMKKIKEAVSEDLTKVFTTNEDDEGINPGSATWWASKTPDTIGTVLSLMVPAAGAAGIASKGAKMLGAGAKTAQMAGTVGATVASRYAESTMEANQVFQTTYDQLKKTGITDEEARLRAGDAASKTWNTNWLFALQDFAQFHSIAKGFTSAAKGAKGMSIGEILKQTASEGAEEGGQYIVSEEARKSALDTEVDYFGKGFGKRLSDYIDDPAFKESVFLGAIGGGVFSAAGPLANTVSEQAAKLGGQVEPLAKWFKEKTQQLVKKGLVKERANYVGDTATSQAVDNDTFVNQVSQHLDKGTLGSLKQGYEDQAKQSGVSDEGRKALKDKAEDVDFIINEQAQLKNSKIPAPLHNEIIFTKLDQRNQSKIKKTLSKDIQDIKQEAIKNEELSVELNSLKDAQIAAEGYARLAAAQPQFVEKAKLAARNYADAFAAAQAANPEADVKKAITTSQDEQLFNKAFQLASTNEKISKLKDDLISYTTPEGLAKAAQEVKLKQEVIEATQLANNPGVTKDQLQAAITKAGSPQTQAVLNTKLQELNNATSQENKQQTQTKLEEYTAPDEVPGEINIPEPTPVEPTPFDPSQFDPEQTIVTPDYGGLTYNQVKDTFGVKQADEFLARLSTESKPEPVPVVTTKKEEAIVAKKIAEETDTVPVWLKVIDDNKQPIQYYDNVDQKKVNATDVFATDEHGQLLMDTPLVKVGDKVTLRVVDDGQNSQFKFTLTPGFKPTKQDNYVINVYMEGVERPIAQLPSLDNPLLQNKKAAAALRSRVISAPGQSLQTTIASKSIGDFKLKGQEKSVEVLEFDYHFNEQGQPILSRTPYNPIFGQAGFNNLIQIPNVGSMKGVNQQTLDLIETVRSLPRPNEVSPGATFTLRMAPTGTFRLAKVLPRLLTSNERTWVKQNLAELIGSKNTGVLSEVLHVPEHGAGVYSTVAASGETKKPDITKAKQNRFQIVQVSDTSSEFLLPLSGVWIVLNSTAKTSQLKSFLENKPFSFGIIDSTGKRLLSKSSTEIAPENLAKIYKAFESTLDSSFYNVKTENLNAEIGYTDPITGKNYPTYYNFIKENGIISTDLPGSNTNEPGQGSSYSFNNAGLHLDPVGEVIKVETKGDEITSISNPEPLPPAPDVQVPTDVDPLDAYYGDGKLREVNKVEGFQTMTQKELDWFKENIGEKYLAVAKGVDRILTNGGVEAFGMYHNALVTIADFAETGSLYHEAFHFAFDQMLTPNEQARILQYGTEEKLAEDFRTYMLSDGSVAPKIEKSKNFFRRLLDTIKGILGLRSPIEKLFEDIRQNKLEKINPNLQDAEKGEQYRLLPGFRYYRQQEDAVMATTTEIMKLAREYAKQAGVEPESLFNNINNVNKYFEEVKNTFTNDYNRISANPANSRTAVDHIRFATYQAMGIGPEPTGIWEDVSTETQVDTGFKTEVLKNFAKFGFTVKLSDTSSYSVPEVDQEDPENDIEEKKSYDKDEKIYDLDHTLLSPARSLSQGIKMFLSSIPEPVIDDNGQIVYESDGKTPQTRKTVFGTPKIIDFQRAFTNLTAKLADTSQPFVELERLSRLDPISKVIYDNLVAEKNSGNVKLFNEFNTKFNLSRRNYVTIIDENNVVKVIATNQGDMDKTILANWRQESIRKNLIEEDGTVNGAKVKFLQSRISKYKTEYLAAEQARKPLPFDGVKKEFTSILKDIGVSVPEQVWKELEFQKVSKEQTLKSWFFGLNRPSLENFVNVAADGVDPYSQTGVINILANKSKFFVDDVKGGVHLNEKGDQVNPINSPSYITEFINNAKESPEDVTSFFAQDKFYEGNKFLELLRNRDGRDKLGISFVSASRKGDSEAKDFSERTSTDSYILRLASFFNGGSSLTGKFAVITFADKAQQALLDLPKYTTVDRAKNFLRTVLKSTVQQETARIQRIKQFQGSQRIGQPLPSDIKDYGTGGLKFVYIPSINDVPGAADSLTNGELSPDELQAKTEQINQKIEDYIEQEYQKFEEDLITKGLIERTPNGIANVLVPTAIANNQALATTLKEFFYNDFAWRHEVSKVLAGDLALYGTNDNFNKRMYELVTPGLKPYNDPSNPQSFTRGVYASIIKTNPQTYIDSLVELGVSEETAEKYARINKTDAQSLTTVGNWKKIGEKFGWWTNDHEMVYQMAWKDNYTVSKAIKFYQLDEIQAKALRKAALVALQTFKPFQYNDRVVTLPDGSKMIIKEQFKDSITPLVPEFATRHSEYRQLLNYMTVNKVDIMSAADTVKVGSYGVINDFNVPIQDWQKRVISLDDLRFPQTISESIKQETSGSQFQKLILGNIKTDKNYNVGGRQIKGDQVIKEYNAAWEEKIINASESLQKKLGLGADLVLSDNPETRNKQLFKIKTVLEQELLSRDLNENYSDAIRIILDEFNQPNFTVSLGFPTVARKFNGVLTNLFKKNILKLKNEGYSLVNLADFGIASSERNSNLEFIRNEGGEVVEAEIGMPVSFFSEIGLNYIEDIDPMTNKIRWNKLNENQKEALQLILYRIPTSGKNSMIPVRVAMVIAPQQGNVVMIPGELTVQQGLDFDFDKSQLIKRVLEKGKIDKSAPDTKIFNLAWSILTSKEHINEVLTPLDFPTLREKLEQYGTVISSTSRAALLSPVSDVSVEEQNKHAKRGVGIASRASTAHSVLQTIKDYVYESQDAKINIKTNKPFNFALGQVLDNTGKHISENHGEIQQADLDAAKNPILAKLNIITVTHPTASFLLSKGLSLNLTLDFLNQPILREWVGMYNVTGGKNAELATRKLLEKYPEVDGQYKRFLENKTSVDVLSEGNLADGVGKAINENITHQAAVLVEFLKYSRLATLMSKVNNVLSIDTFSNMTGVEAIEAMLNQKDEVTKARNPIRLSPSLFEPSTAPAESKRLAAYYHYGLEKALQLLDQFSPYTNESYKAVKDQYAKMMGDVNLQDVPTISKLNTFLDFYTLETNNTLRPILDRIAPDYAKRWLFVDNKKEGKTIQKYLESVISKYPGIKDNAFIKALEPQTSTRDGVQMIGVVNTNKNANKNRMIQGWWDLMINQNEEVRTLAFDLVRFAIYTSGFGYNTRSFIDIVPNQFWIQNGVTRAHRILLNGLIPVETESGPATSTRIDAEGATRGFIRHNFGTIPNFPEAYFSVSTQGTHSGGLLEVDLAPKTAHLRAFTLPKSSPLNSGRIGKTVPTFVRIYDNQANKYRLYESDPANQFRFKEVQPLGEDRAYFEVTQDGRKVSVHPKNRESGSPAPFDKPKTFTELPLFMGGRAGENPYVHRYIPGQQATALEVIQNLLKEEVNPENKATLENMLRNVDKINTPLEVVNIDGSQGGKFTVYKDESTGIKIDPNVEGTAEEVRALITHELDHAFMIGVMKSPNTEAEINFTRNIERLRTEALARGIKQYGLTNKYEFVAELASSKTFREELRKKGFWNRVIRSIRKLFGFKDSYDQALNARYAIIDNGVGLQVGLNQGSYSKLVKEPLKLRKKITLLEQLLATFNSRKERLERQHNRKAAKELEADIEVLKDLMVNKKAEAITRSLIRFQKEVNELKETYPLLAQDPAKINPDILLVMKEQLISYNIFNQLRSELRKNPLAYAPTEESAKVLLSNFEQLSNDVQKLNEDIRTLQIKRNAHIVKQLNPDEELSIAQLEDQLDVADRDIGLLNYQLDPAVDSGDIFVQTVGSMIKHAHAEADRISYEDWHNTTPKQEIVEVDLGDKPTNIGYTKVGMFKALNEYETWLKTQGIDSGSIVDKFKPILNTKTLGKDSTGIEFVSPLSTEGKRIRALADGNPLKQFYETFVLGYLKSQEAYPEALRPGLRVPSVMRKALEGVMREGLNSYKLVKEGLIDAVRRKYDETDRQATDENGNPINYLPIRYISKQDGKDGRMTTREVSMDVANTIGLAMNSAHIYSELQKVLSDAELIKMSLAEREVVDSKRKDFLSGETKANYDPETGQLQTIEGSDSNAYKMADRTIRRLAYGQYKKDAGSAKVLGQTIDIRKSFDSLLRFTGFKILFGKLAIPLTNYAVGKLTFAKEVVGGNLINWSDWKAGQKLAGKALFESFADMGRREKQTKFSRVFQYFNPMDNERPSTSAGIDTNWMRTVSAKVLHAPGVTAEIQLAAETIGAVMNRFKAVDPEGKEVSLYDALEISENGDVSLQKGYTYKGKKSINSKDVDEVRNYALRLYQVMNGVYNNLDSAGINESIVGSAVMFMRNWLRPGIQTRWRVKHFDTRLGQENEGHYISALVAFNNFFNPKNGYLKGVADSLRLLSWFGVNNPELLLLPNEQDLSQEKKDQLIELRKANIRKTLFELYLIAGLSVLLAAAWSGDDDSYMKLMAARIRRELMTFFDPNTAWDVLRSPSVALDTVGKSTKLVYDMVQASGALLTGEELAEYERGVGKGQTKIGYDTKKYFGLGFLDQFEELDQQVKLTVQSRY